MKGNGFTGRRTALMAALLLSSCTHRKPVAVETPPAVVPVPRPVLATNLAAVAPPPVDAAGRYRTINYGIDPVQTEWHVRAALNVAAIGCRGAADGALVNAYNAMLSGQKAELAKANNAVQAKFRVAGGDWQSAHDAYMTRLYNFFSQPAAKANFCAVADRLAPQAAAPAGGFQSFAAQALPQLEAPFLETYRQVDAYKVALARWQAGETTQLAAAASAAVAGPAPQLGYADMSVLLAWQPADGMRVAVR
ncbi:hypothetical protein HZF05_04860 [Sphingomonas sp. CGMCC 1.13654]|uniref:Lipoprotein n=1 Tax=Sphingomonas chungangi TaxID=2683589 RepID=A0A838L4D6_9SPHN|nr:hypothetical protein [Sphingomonas chungangi]MBA2933422.1 hypothetical protein [Sphingomonas chungangi]MVW54755.1 hypothetical protein [Sphingomonas chungangi]